MAEGLHAYIRAFDQYRKAVLTLLGATDDLATIQAQSVRVLTDPALAVAARYLAAPPISSDDLKILAGTRSLAQTEIRNDPALAATVMETILAGLDPRRFAWVAAGRRPTRAEREIAVQASAALLASQRVQTDRRTIAKKNQEQEVALHLRALPAKLSQVRPRPIPNLTHAPAPGEFCGESNVAGQKADIVVRLWDGRLMAIECKSSNTEVNSYKRLIHEAGGKSEHWLRALGEDQILPSAVLSGVFNLDNLDLAQNDRGLTLFWAHDLTPLGRFVDSAR
jgi:hypothetical protein